ncbi:MAG TPA: hypothetical protein VGI46_09735 [Candidatus Acidoferrum sp.]|jgi:hypothetical protein
MRESSKKKKRPKIRSNTKRTRRIRLAKATAAYFASLSGEALREEQKLERALGHAASAVDFDADGD